MSDCREKQSCCLSVKLIFGYYLEKHNCVHVDSRHPYHKSFVVVVVLKGIMNRFVSLCMEITSRHLV